jgi:AcrR family transcriptional regulator
MESTAGTPRRRYHAPARLAGAARTRAAIVEAAHERFGERGWSGTTIRDVAEAADVSPKTIEAVFGT